MHDVESISRRMESIAAVGEIVSALRVLSAVELQKATRSLSNLRAYELDLGLAFEMLWPMLNDGANGPSQIHGPGQNHDRRRTGVASRPVTIVVGSDQGFSGSLTRRIVEHAHERADLADPSRVIAVGARTRDLLAVSLGADVRCHPSLASSDGLDRLVSALTEDVAGAVASQRADGLLAVHAVHLGGSRYRPEVSRLLPAAPPSTVKTSDRSERESPRVPVLGGSISGRPILQVPIEELARNLLEEWTFQGLCKVVLESLASEYGARLETTDAATHNIEKRLARLGADLHEARQEQTTIELHEILAAAEAL